MIKKPDWLNILIFFVVSLGTICIYDYAIISPKLKTSQIETIDVELLISKNEKLVRDGKINMDTYRKRLALAEEYISKHDTVLLNQYIKVDGKLYPLAFGGIDITDNIDKKMEEIK